MGGCMVISKTEIREKPTAQATQVPATPTPIPILRIEPQRIELNGAWRLRADPGDEGENDVMKVLKRIKAEALKR